MVKTIKAQIYLVIILLRFNVILDFFYYYFQIKMKFDIMK